MIKKLTKDADYAVYQGRIIFRDGITILGFTNSSVTLKFRGKSLSAVFTTGHNDTVNEPGLRIYIDGKAEKELVIKSAEYNEKPQQTVIASFGEEGEHEVRIVKITAAAMSYVGISDIETDGELLPVTKKEGRKKALFIGDSITCGYGVLGEPESEYTLRDEDGELSYAAVMARKMDWEAEWVSVSGFGMFVEYTGNPENIVPKIFAYQNWFYDKEMLTDYSEFVPDYIILNLGTNDSGPMTNDKNIRLGYLARYESFLYTLRMAYPDAAIICTLGTLAPGYYKYVDQVLQKVKKDRFENIYGLELPEHDVKNDGMASGHPSKITHEKDADRIISFMKNEGII
ncbi:MAG: hypothetical protein K6C35_02020 [Eubacterium sp.]|nr:hypothetical protein [Eubacterium sp.]